jgi:glycosyltransferase involved in cell wall biosynthesis
VTPLEESKHHLGAMSADARVQSGPAGSTLSFVIPARNEEGLISATIDSIHRAVRRQYPYEVVVVDNGSVDATREVAASHGAVVISQPSGTISSVRNTGVRHTRGEYIVFLDADVVLTDQWADRIPAALQLLSTHPYTLTGSMCSVPASGSWLERLWFEPRSGELRSHIGTGHLITTRRLFDRLSGFNESLETGEDYDFSQRTRSFGGRIVDDPLLHVEHWGFPRTLSDFIRREIWHGRSDFRSLGAVFRSRVALGTLAFAVLHVMLMLSLALLSVQVFLISVMLITLICFGSSCMKYRRAPWYVLIGNGFLFYVYYLGRTLSATSLPARSRSQVATGDASLTRP